MADKEGLRSSVEALLEADGEDSDFLEESALGTSPSWLADAEWLLDRGRLGPFELLSQLGAGSMGVVFLARREGSDELVALKVAREGTAPHIRLKQEGQILARLVHPAIASVLDVGVADGRPYVSLEYVVGTPIDEYCRTSNLPEIIHIFLQICDGVEAAHRNLVVHRDLKPSHILITADGSPKLLDFGVAKLLADSGQGQPSTATRAFGHSATPAYASPEQLRGEPANTGSDVYSLGVVLYQTLTGNLPRQVSSFRERDLVAVFAKAPAAPSAVAHRDGARREGAWTERFEGAGGRGGLPRERRKSSRLSKDLDAIVLKALRPETESRYLTVASFAHDLRRCLRGEVVAARRWTPFYRASRFVHRHRGWALAGTLIALFLLVFGINLQVQSNRLRAESQRARGEKMQAEQVTSFISDLLRRTNPEHASPEKMTVDEMLEWGSQELQSARGLSPQVREELLSTLGEVNASRRHLQEARWQLEEALALRQERVGAAGPGVTDLQYQLAWVMTIQGDRGEAETLARQVVASRRSTRETDPVALADSLRLLSSVLVSRARLEEVESLALEADALYRASEGDHSEQIASVELSLALVWRFQGRFSKALELQRRGLERLRAEEPPDPLAISDFVQKLSIALIHSETHLQEAENLLSEALVTEVEVFGSQSAVSALTRVRLGQLRTVQGRYEQARRELDAALTTARETQDFETIALTLFFQGELHLRQGQSRQAEAVLAEADSLMRRSIREDHPYFLALALLRGGAALDLGDLTAAKGFVTQSEAICLRAALYYRCHGLLVLQGRLQLVLQDGAQGSEEPGRRLIAEGHRRFLDLLGQNHSLTREAERWL